MAKSKSNPQGGELENGVPIEDINASTPDAEPTSENAEEQDVQELLALVEKLRTENAKLDSMVNEYRVNDQELRAQNQKLKEQLEGFVKGSIAISEDAAPDISIPTDPVEINGAMYAFKKPFATIDQKVYSAREIASSPEILQRLLSIEGQTMLSEIV